MWNDAIKIHFYVCNVYNVVLNFEPVIFSYNLYLLK